MIFYVMTCPYKNMKLCCGCSSMTQFGVAVCCKHSASFQIESDCYCFNQRPRWTLVAFSSLASMYLPRPSRQWRTPAYWIVRDHTGHTGSLSVPNWSKLQWYMQCMQFCKVLCHTVIPNSFHLSRATQLNPPNSQGAQVTPLTSLHVVPLCSTMVSSTMWPPSCPFLYVSSVIRSMVCCVFSLPTFPCLAFSIQPLALQPVGNVVHCSNKFHRRVTRHVRTCQSPKSLNPAGHLLHGSGHGYASPGTLQVWTKHTRTAFINSSLWCLWATHSRGVAHSYWLPSSTCH